MRKTTVGSARAARRHDGLQSASSVNQIQGAMSMNHHEVLSEIPQPDDPVAAE